MDIRKHFTNGHSQTLHECSFAHYFATHYNSVHQQNYITPCMANLHVLWLLRSASNSWSVDSWATSRIYTEPVCDFINYRVIIRVACKSATHEPFLNCFVSSWPASQIYFANLLVKRLMTLKKKSFISIYRPTYNIRMLMSISQSVASCSGRFMNFVETFFNLPYVILV